jgi:RNA polymerase sigma factor (sigma-70 family)
MLPTARLIDMHEEDLTAWIDQLKEGGARSQEQIWNAYFEDLVALTRKRLNGVRKRDFDEEDIAISAFHSFFRAVKEKRLPKLEDRTDLWKVLIVIAARKISTQHKRDSADKRGGGKVRGESVFIRATAECEFGLEHALGREPTPEFAGEVADTFEQLMKHLPDENLRRIAALKLEGYSSREIANQLSCVERTVERKLERIRAAWLKLHPAVDVVP